MTTHETNLISMWIDNDQALYSMTRQFAEDNGDVVTLADELESALTDPDNGYMPELSGFALDLMNAALSEVDWREIAQDLLDELAENETEAEEA